MDLKNRKYTLTCPDSDNKSKDFKMTESQAIKVLTGKNMSKKWAFKDNKFKLVPKDNGYAIEAVK